MIDANTLYSLPQLPLLETHEIPKKMVSRVNLSTNNSIMGCNMLEKHVTDDGRVLYFNFGNGYGQWFDGGTE